MLRTTQLTKGRAGLNMNLQPPSQKEAHFVGSSQCNQCHKEEHKHWTNSLHSKMIQDISKNPDVVIADFTKLPKDADFTLAQAVYTIG